MGDSFKDDITGGAQLGKAQLGFKMGSQAINAIVGATGAVKSFC